jgi:uncharacterized protein (TIGR02266 family)
MRTEPTQSNTEQASAAERRAHPRFPLRINVDFNSEHNFYTGFTEDISEGGLFISTYQTNFTIGDIMEMSFTLPGFEKPFYATCEVRWIRTYNPDSDTGPGMGLRFIDLPNDVKSSIQRFLKQRQSLFFVD